jgi:hypothetical protein
VRSRQAARPRLGAGALAFKRDGSVFINCPFDPEFRPAFDAIVFATICCGFFPRCAIESGSVAVPRMERIVQALRGSKYSVHDLSRCRGEGEANLARFNMPLELGIAMGEGIGRRGSSYRHDWLLLVPRDHPYRRFISDLAGYDPTEYDGTVAGVVPAVMAWLATRPDAVQCPTPDAVLGSLPDFYKAAKELGDRWRGQTPWADLVLEAMRVGQHKALIPVSGP